MIDAEHGWNKSYKPQFIGFVTSLLLTLAAYRLVTHFHLTGTMLILAILGLASIQGLLQLFFFLHVGMESKPHWIVISFLFTVLVVLIIVVGSLWIMNNLNYNLMTPMTH